MKRFEARYYKPKNKGLRVGDRILLLTTILNEQKLRSSLASMELVRAIAQSLVSFAIPFYEQIQQMQAVAQASLPELQLSISQYFGEIYIQITATIEKFVLV